MNQEEDITLENKLKKKKKGNHVAEKEFTDFSRGRNTWFLNTVYTLNSFLEMTELINFYKALQVSHSKFWCFQVPKEVSNLKEFKIFTCI